MLSWNIINFQSYKFQNQRAALSPPATVYVLVGIISNKANDTVVAPSNNWVSTESQQYLALHLGISRGYTGTWIHNWTIGHRSRQNWLWQHHYSVLKISFDGASTLLALHVRKYKGCQARYTNNWTIDSDCNGPGQSVRVLVRVGTKLLTNWHFRLSLYPNRQFEYSSMKISQPVWIGQVVSGLPSRSIRRFI